jgi:hypothetical protein
MVFLSLLGGAFFTCFFTIVYDIVFSTLAWFLIDIHDSLWSQLGLVLVFSIILTSLGFDCILQFLLLKSLVFLRCMCCLCSFLRDGNWCYKVHPFEFMTIVFFFVFQLYVRGRCLRALPLMFWIAWAFYLFVCAIFWFFIYIPVFLFTGFSFGFSNGFCCLFR